MDGMDRPRLLSIEDAIGQMKSGEATAQTIVDACERQIEKRNAELCAFVTVLDRPVVKEAKPAGRLGGIPIAVKDLFETKGIRTTAGTSFFKDYVPEADAVAVQKIKQQGAVVMGKTNTHEIALGVTTVNSHFGTTRAARQWQ